MTDPTNPVPTPDPRLAEIAERLAKATPGPWYSWPAELDGFEGEFDVVGADKCCIASMAGTAEAATIPRDKEDNAIFIAHAPEDIGYLLSEAARKPHRERLAVEWADAEVEAEDADHQYFSAPEGSERDAASAKYARASLRRADAEESYRAHVTAAGAAAKEEARHG